MNYHPFVIPFTVEEPCSFSEWCSTSFTLGLRFGQETEIYG